MFYWVLNIHFIFQTVFKDTDIDGMFEYRGGLVLFVLLFSTLLSGSEALWEKETWAGKWALAPPTNLSSTATLYDPLFCWNVLLLCSTTNTTQSSLLTVEHLSCHLSFGGVFPGFSLWTCIMSWQTCYDSCEAQEDQLHTQTQPWFIHGAPFKRRIPLQWEEMES